MNTGNFSIWFFSGLQWPRFKVIAAINQKKDNKELANALLFAALQKQRLKLWLGILLHIYKAMLTVIHEGPKIKDNRFIWHQKDGEKKFTIMYKIYIINNRIKLLLFFLSYQSEMNNLKGTSIYWQNKLSWNLSDFSLLTFGLRGFSMGMSVPSARCLLESKTLLFLHMDFWQILACLS